MKNGVVLMIFLQGRLEAGARPIDMKILLLVLVMGF